MNRFLHHAAFGLGLAAVAWVAAGYGPAHPLALALLLPIVAAYLAGAWELQRFRQATEGLMGTVAATAEPPPALGPWLQQLPTALQGPVRQRVDGERVPLPGLALTPTLTGLLVLLGMLGTFLGMVATLQGTGLALENATDVDAIRASLAAPVKGLGLAFGTSVAGVAASATLGLMSALSRRERQRAVQRLDACIAGPLRSLSRPHRQAEEREQHQTELLRLQRLQADALGQALPGLVTQIEVLTQTLATQLDQQGRHLAEQLLRQGQAQNDALQAAQQRFHAEAQQAYAGLAASVDRSLKDSLSESARLAGAALQPAVQATLDGLGRAAQQQAQQAQQALTAALAGFEQQAVALRHAAAEAQAAADAAATAREQARQADFQQALLAFSATLQRQAQQDAQAAAERQQQICSALERSAQAITAQAEAQARSTLGEIGRLVQAASEAPRAAAQVIGELRSALSDSLVRDNAVLDERNRLMATLGGLLDAVNHASTEQRSAIDALVRSTTEVLQRVGERFADTVDAESRTLQAVAAQVTGSAAEVASLGEGFGFAVQRFSSASEQLAAQLQRIEAALGQSMARSDEQLAYYVAQAREIIDLTLGSQKQIVDDLQQLARSSRAPTAPAEAQPA